MSESEDKVQKRFENLEQVVKNCKGMLILTHDNPDPDALASAVGFKYLFQKKWGVRTRVAYGGIVGRAENKAMLRVLKLRVESIERIKLSSYRNITLVDTQPKTGNNSLPEKMNARIVVDHHPKRRGYSAAFQDIRVEYGSTSTIAAEYIQQAGLEIPPDLATALFYGIASDTRHLGRHTSEADVKVYMSLLSLANMRKLSKIEFPPLPKSYFENIECALENAFTHRNIIGSRLGEIDNPDVIPEFADLLLRHDKATWAICLGCWNGHLIISLRTSNPRADAGRIVRRLVGKKGRAGGHGMMAAGKISCVQLDDEKLIVLEMKIIRKFLKLLGKRESAALEPLIDSSLISPDTAC